MEENNLVDLDKLIITGSIAEYDLSDTGEIGGTYKGKFKFTCFLTPIQLVDQDREQRQLLGDNSAFANPDSDNLAYILTQLKYRIVEAPPFWKSNESRYGGGAVADINIINHVFAAAFASESVYRKRLKEKKDKALEGLKQALEKREKANSVKPKEKAPEEPKA